MLLVHAPDITCLYLNSSAVIAHVLKTMVSGLGAYLCYYLHYLRRYLCIHLLLLVCTQASPVTLPVLLTVFPNPTPFMTYSYLSSKQPRMSILT